MHGIMGRKWEILKLYNLDHLLFCRLLREFVLHQLIFYGMKDILEIACSTLNISKLWLSLFSVADSQQLAL